MWDQHALREFIKRHPLIGASLQKAIAVDLVNKVVQSRDHREHYRQLLAETLDGGRVTSTERKNLQRCLGYSVFFITLDNIRRSLTCVPTPTVIKGCWYFG